MRTLLIIIGMCALIAVPLVADADDLPGKAIEVGDIKRLVERVVQMLITVASLAVVGFIVYGGMKMAMSAGNPTKFEEGKKIVINAVIGAAVIFGVGVIVNTIADFSDDPTTIINY
jgi:lysylphosphatidylglycerol synthetase-like protein (DUF2156 family)